MTRVVVIPHGFQQHYSLGFANGLASQGIPVDFVSAANVDTTLLHPNIIWKDLGCNTENRISAVRKAARFVAYHLRLIRYLVARRGAIIHVIGLIRRAVVPIGIIEGMLFRVLAGKYVFTVHNVLPHDSHTIWNRWVFKLVYRIPHLLVVHTAKMKDDLVTSFGVREDRVVVMQHGLNDIVPDHGRSRDECRAQFGLPEGACVLLFFGRIRPYKGVETLLEAFREVSGDLFLVIAGAPANAAYGHRIEELVQQHPHRKRILYHAKFIDDADLASYFRAADALVMPYRHIDQSGVLFLAFRFGLPVIAFDIGALRDYLKNDAGILVQGGGAQDLAVGIKRFQRETRIMAAGTIRAYAHRFRWEEVLKPLIAAYRAG
jgi:glycosyltransferase involved in cell wall biosynthesis